MLGVLINGLATSVCAFLGMLAGKGLKDRWLKAVYSAIGLCIICMGVQGAIKTENWILVTVSMAAGTVLGTAVGIEDTMQRLGSRFKTFFHAGKDTDFTNTFVTLSIIQVVGAMAVLGPIQATLLGDVSLLYIKSLLDGISAFIFGAVSGAGAIPVGIVLIIYEGFFCLVASFLAPVMTDAAVRELSAVGNILIIVIGFNMLGIVKLKTADYLPAMFMPVVYYFCMSRLM